LVVVLLFASLFCLVAQNVQSDNTGGWGVFLGVVPLLDKYGHVSMNEDGTFYPTDRFEITYSTELTSEVDFEKIELHYDRSVFNMFSSNFGAEGVGGGCFEVLSSASAGVYSFNVEVWGNRSTTNDDSGSECYVMAEVSLFVVVVEYDPHFTVALTYTVPTGNGSSSYEKPFALIVRYEGNGPDRNLGQRAVIDDFVWEGYAQKIPQIGQMQQSLTPNLTVASFLNQSSNTQFLAQGIDDEAKVSQLVLSVDGQGFASKDFPVGFLWETNTNHSYVWTQILPVDGVGGGGVYGEWFEWQASIVFPPSIDPNQSNQTAMSQEDLQNQLVEQFNTPNGTLITSPFGNTVTAMYAHNKRIDLFAKEVGVEKNQTLNCLIPLPLYFTSQERYAKLQYQLNPAVVAEITNQGFTHALYYNLTTGCSLFGAPRYFDANTTCEYEFFDKLFNATAYKWDHTLQTWSIDPSVTINAAFESAFSFTETDLLRSSFEEQTSDKETLKLAMSDLYDSGPQMFKGTGSIEAHLRRSSPLYYNLQIAAGQKQTTVLQRTIELNFRDNNPYNLPLNFDATSPLQIDIIADTTQNTLLSLNAPKELGGITNITIYLVTNIPTGKTIQTISPDSLSLSLLKTMNLTLPQEQTQKPLGYEENYQQFYQQYQGYSTIAKEETWGFCGQTQIALSKDQKIVALTEQNEALLYIEATNVWGTTFHQIIPVQPYAKPQWNIPLDKATTYLIAIVIIAIILSVITYLIKTKQTL
jgi:hypothetical protein